MLTSYEQHLEGSVNTLWFVEYRGSCIRKICNYSPHTTKLLRVYSFDSVSLSVCPYVRPASGVCSIASTIQDGFFPYLVQMINSRRGCVAYDDPLPWPISSRSFGLDLENLVCSVAVKVLDGFFFNVWHKWSLSLEGVSRVTFFFRIWKFEFEINLSWPWKKIYSSQWTLSIFSTNDY